MKSRHLIALVAVLIALHVACSTPSSVADLLLPFRFQRAGEPPLLVLACGALFVGLAQLRQSPAHALGLVALFVGSLVVSALVYPLLIYTAWLADRHPYDRTVRLVVISAPAVALVVALGKLLLSPEAASWPETPRDAVAYWEGRQNLYRARAVAYQWSKTEAPPGEAYTTLARLDWKLGRQAQARRVLAKVIERSSDPETRSRARSLGTSWDESPTTP